MKRMHFASLVALSLAMGAGAAFAQTAPAAAPKMSEFPSPAVEKYARTVLAQIEKDPKIIEAIKASTKETRKLGYDETIVRDQLWTLGRAKGKDDADTKKGVDKALGVMKENGVTDPAEVSMQKGADLVAKIRGSDTSKALAAIKDKSNGQVTEIFVMDGNGWNVGQTDGTSDFYQGDEGKWQKTYLDQEVERAGDTIKKEDKIKEKGVEVLPIVEEDGVRYSQISLPIKDGEKNIGAVTIGVDVSKVK